MLRLRELLTINIIPTFPYITGTLTITNTCDPGGSGTYDLNFFCFGLNSVVLRAAGVKLCNGTVTDDEDEECDHSFGVQISCETCTAETDPECIACIRQHGPPAWKIVGSGFTGASADYNGTWIAPRDPDNDCAWFIECGDITVTVELTKVGADGVMTVTYSGGAGGTVVFIYAPTGLIECFTAHTATYSSGVARLRTWR